MFGLPSTKIHLHPHYSTCTSYIVTEVRLRKLDFILCQGQKNLIINEISLYWLYIISTLTFVYQEKKYCPAQRFEGLNSVMEVRLLYVTNENLSSVKCHIKTPLQYRQNVNNIERSIYWLTCGEKSEF